MRRVPGRVLCLAALLLACAAVADPDSPLRLPRPSDGRRVAHPPSGVSKAPSGSSQAGAPVPRTARDLRLNLDGVEVVYRPGDAGLARQAGLAVRRACDRIERDLGLRFESAVTVTLARGRAEYLKHCGTQMPEWSMAAALPARDGMVIDASKVTPATANDLGFVVAHETAHLVLGRLERKRGEKLPLWFHEGIAVWVSGQAPLRGARTSFTLAATQGILLPFDDLADAFPEDPADADLAYLQSEAFIGHLVKTRSAAGLRRLLSLFRDGHTFNNAFEEAIGAPRRTVETQWARSYRRPLPWLRALRERISLLTLIALGTILAFVIVRLRARRQRQRWLHEERMWQIVDPEESEENETPDREEDRPF